MDVHYLYRGLNFVWDGMKANENRSKHGISFEEACEVFSTMPLFMSTLPQTKKREAR